MTLYRWLAASSLLLASVQVVLACSSSDSTPTNTPTTTTKGDASTGTDSGGGDTNKDAGTVCNALTPGADVPVQIAHGPLTGSFSGGPIADGTYNLTGVVIYEGEGDGGIDTTSSTAASSVVIKGTSYELVLRQAGETATEKGTLGGSGETVTFTPACNSEGDLTVTTSKVDIDGDTIVVVKTEDDGQMSALLYKKAP